MLWLLSLKQKFCLPLIKSYSLTKFVGPYISAHSSVVVCKIWVCITYLSEIGDLACGALKLQRAAWKQAENLEFYLEG